VALCTVGPRGLESGRRRGKYLLRKLEFGNRRNVLGTSLHSEDFSGFTVILTLVLES
jgi:hypothetical protein